MSEDFKSVFDGFLKGGVSREIKTMNIINRGGQFVLIHKETKAEIGWYSTQKEAIAVGESLEQ